MPADFSRQEIEISQDIRQEVGDVPQGLATVGANPPNPKSNQAKTCRGMMIAIIPRVVNEHPQAPDVSAEFRQSITVMQKQQFWQEATRQFFSSITNFFI